MGGQRLVAVTVTGPAPGRHHRPSVWASQAIWKHCPHDAPPLKSTWLSAVVAVPYPVV